MIPDIVDDKKEGDQDTSHPSVVDDSCMACVGDPLMLRWGMALLLDQLLRFWITLLVQTDGIGISSVWFSYGHCIENGPVPRPFFRQVALIYTYELPSVKGFVHEGLLDVYFKTEGGIRTQRGKWRGKGGPVWFG